MKGFRKKFTFLLVASLVVFLIAGLLLLFFIKDINKKVQEASSYQQELAHRGAILDRIQNLEREAGTANSYLALLNDALPDETEVIALEGKLKSLAAVNNLNSLSFRFGALSPLQASEPKSYSFNLVADGQLTALIGWLDGFQKLPYSFRLEQIEMNQFYVFGSPAGDIYSIKILGRIYLR